MVVNLIIISPLGEKVGGEPEVSASPRFKTDVQKTLEGGGKGRRCRVRGAAAADNRDLGKACGGVGSYVSTHQKLCVHPQPYAHLSTQHTYTASQPGAASLARGR